MFFSVEVVSFVLGAIWPLFDSLSVLLILVPLTNVGGTICVLVGAVAVSFVVQPLALVNVSVGMDQGSVAVRLVSLPLAIILGSVLPHLLPVAVLHSIEELSRVDSSVT